MMNTTPLLVKNAVFLDVRTGDFAEADLLAVDGVIAELGQHLQAPAGCRIIDARGRFAIPGLIDCHVHVTASTASLGDGETESPYYTGAQAAVLMGNMLDRGFTTVRDTGGADFGLARAQREGLIRGPRLHFGGRALSQTGGHGDFRTAGDNRAKDASCCGIGRVVDGRDEARLAARDELRKGADHVKIMVSGGVASPTDRIDSTQFSLDEIDAIVAEATAANRYVAAHAYTARAINRALERGVRTIEHGNLLDETSIALFLEHDAFLVPTLVTYWSLQEEGRQFGLSEESWSKVDDVLHSGLKTLELASRSGVNIAYGSDLLGGMQRHQVREFSIRREVQSAIEVIQSATLTAAQLLGREGSVGELVVGGDADLILLERNPVEEVSVLTNPEKHLTAVVQRGSIVAGTLRSID